MSDDAEDAYAHVVSYIHQLRDLSLALQTVLEVECGEPLEGSQPKALAKAVERASEDALSMFKAHYHPNAEKPLDALARFTPPFSAALFGVTVNALCNDHTPNV